MSYQRKIPLNPKELRKLIDLDKKDWENKQNTNCYAYALGLDVNIPKAFEPGEIGHSKTDLRNYNSFTYELLLDNIFTDLEALDIAYREIDPIEEIAPDEWKIALFTTRNGEYIDDFHFMREHKDGIWYHKNGTRIYNKTNLLFPIKNPKTVYLPGREYEKCLSLRLK